MSQLSSSDTRYAPSASAWLQAQRQLLSLLTSFLCFRVLCVVQVYEKSLDAQETQLLEQLHRVQAVSSRLEPPNGEPDRHCLECKKPTTDGAGAAAQQPVHRPRNPAKRRNRSGRSSSASASEDTSDDDE